MRLQASAAQHSTQQMTCCTTNHFIPLVPWYRSLLVLESLRYAKHIANMQTGLFWYLWIATAIGCFWTTPTLVSAAQQDGSVEYGVDVSFPMHHARVSANSALGNRQAEFDEYLEGCVGYYNDLDPDKPKGFLCHRNEADRIAMSLRQPAGMFNYTELGFTKIRAPPAVFALLQNFWKHNSHRQEEEAWPTGNIYVNHWEDPTYMVSVEDTSLEGGGYVLKQHIWNAARDTISQWTGQQLAECSLYGIRVYKEGAILAPHVDRLPLVSSAIINVDQDVDEPWPLEVIGHDGKAYNVTMTPGDMVLYESHSVIHGRPYRLKGRFMANVFIHFEPIGGLEDSIKFEEGGLPPYVVPGTAAEAHWWSQHPSGHKLLSQRSFTTGSTEAHRAANVGDYERLKTVLDKSPHLVGRQDANGWSPLHEAVRSGNLQVLELLLERGADVNQRVGRRGEGGTALYLAKEYHRENDEEESEVEAFLKQHNARLVEPEL